jgi:mannosyltransferase
MKEELEFDELAPWLVIFITLLTGFLRVLLLASKGMWLDETMSVWLANHSVAEVLQWTAKIDPHPPLYYLLLHYWIALNGDSPYYVRLLSALFGAATIPVIYLIGKRMSGATMGFAAAVLLALSPFNIRFAQEARMYTCLTFNAAVAIYALVRLLSDSRSLRPIGSQFRDYVNAWRTVGPVESDPKADFSYEVRPSAQTGWRGWIARHRWSPIRTVETDLAWLAFIVFSAATLLTHNTAVFFALATNIFVLGLLLYQRTRKPTPLPAFQAPSLSNWVKAQIGIFLLWSPWIVAFIGQVKGVYREFWLPKPGWDTVIQALKSFLNDSTSAQGKADPAMMIWILYALVLGLGLVYYRRKISQFLFLAALFCIPILGELIVSLGRPIFYDRTLIWISIPLFLVLAAGVSQLKSRLLVFLALMILGSINMFSTSDYLRFMQKENWSDAAGYVANFAQNGDLVLFNGSQVQIPFDYYFQSYEKQYDIQVEKHGVPVDVLESGVAESRMTESDTPALVSLLKGRTRVWLVYSHNRYTDPGGLIPQTAASNLKLTRQRDFYGGQVQLYEAP